MNTNETMARLSRELTPANLGSAQMQQLLRSLPLESREEIARTTHTMVHYYGEEVARVRKDEELAVLRAAPQGYPLSLLNGVNVGCGDRTINQYLLGTDAHRGNWDIGGAQAYQALSAICCAADDLPFKSNSMDYLVALHILEHIPDPVAAVLRWLDVVKPGGGVGIVVPDWRYTWDARHDNHPWGHRWNPTPQLVRRLYDEHWSQVSRLEHLESYKWKLSFDVVLRKHGEFHPFDPEDAVRSPTGYELTQNGRIFHSEE